MNADRQVSYYLFPGPVHFGFGAVAKVGAEAKARGGKHVFLLADPGVAAAGLVEPVAASLRGAGVAYTLYDRVVPNPTAESVDAAGEIWHGSQADLIVGLGGGSGLDTAKALRLLAGGGGRIAEYSLRLGDKARPVPLQMPQYIAIPTTAGTGSEVTPWAVITDPGRKVKFGVGNEFLMPALAIVDPELILTLPPFLTAATGMDTLTHLIEAYVSTIENPALDPMILYGIELVGRSLRVAAAQGSNRAARYEMSLAALIGGIAVSSRWLGACHSLAHQLSGFADVHHGLANAIMLPHQMEYSLPGALERYARIGEALGAAGGGTVRQRAERAPEAVRELCADLGLPLRLRDVGVTEEMIKPMARNAYHHDSNWKTNPRLINEAGLEQLYRNAF